MATATDRHLGNDELVYVATTEPTVPGSKADAAYKLVGLQTTFSYASQAQSTDIKDKLGTATLYGANTRTGTLGANTSLVGDDGQTILTNAGEAAGKPDVWILITSGVAGQRFRAFKAKVGGINDGAPVDAASTIEWNLGINGAPTIGVVA